ncbi:uncharacterized protein B0H18DRAFT_1165231, partial [Fomitopsis serialis]|uniref:uncharacterized protein n=1 Tax=Fomitopsis serialis TaxID=139415 RepID=UPI0020072573
CVSPPSSLLPLSSLLRPPPSLTQRCLRPPVKSRSTPITPASMPTQVPTLIRATTVSTTASMAISTASTERPASTAASTVTTAASRTTPGPSTHTPRLPRRKPRLPPSRSVSSSSRSSTAVLVRATATTATSTGSTDTNTGSTDTSMGSKGRTATTTAVSTTPRLLLLPLPQSPRSLSQRATWTNCSSARWRRSSLARCTMMNLTEEIASSHLVTQDVRRCIDDVRLRAS